MIDHKSINEHRLKSNPTEQKFLKKWKHIAPNTLGYILYGNDRWYHNVSQREAEVAASVIQWLGSPVGQGFLNDCEHN